MTHQQQNGTLYVFIRISLSCLFLGCCQIAGAGVQWKRHAIADLPDRAMFIHASDLDSDSHPDLIAGGWWWKNPGHLGGTWKQATIGEPLRNMAIVYDFDADGDPDILGTDGVGAAKNTNFVWARNNGKGQFTIHKNINYTGGGDFLQGCTAAPLGQNHSSCTLLAP